MTATNDPNSLATGKRLPDLMNRPQLAQDKVTRVLGVHLDQTTEKLVAGALTSVGGMEFVGNHHQYFGERDATLVRAFREHQPEICLVSMDTDRSLALETVQYLRSTSSGSIGIFGVSAHMDSDSIIEAMRAGCTEYLDYPLRPDRLTSALLEISRRKRELPVTAQHGKIIALIGVKGGVGTTTLAVHLAHTLSKNGSRTLLIDDHADLGDATLHLGLDDRSFGFHELVRNVQRLDAELLQGFLIKHDSGLEVLASPETLEMAAPFTAQAISQTLRALARLYEYIIIDARSGVDELNMALFESSDQIYLIASPALPDIRNMSRYLQYLSRVGFPVSSTHVVLNKVSRNNAVPLEQVEKVLRIKIPIQLPLAVDELTSAINNGVPAGARSKSEFVQSIQRWAQRLGEGTAPKVAPQQATTGARSRLNVLGITT
ncbi:MAG: hypothetical protein NVSMB3_07940 [Acidobacteriaceae bacterium]